MCWLPHSDKKLGLINFNWEDTRERGWKLMVKYKIFMVDSPFYGIVYICWCCDHPWVCPTSPGWRMLRLVWQSCWQEDQVAPPPPVWWWSDWSWSDLVPGHCGPPLWPGTWCLAAAPALRSPPMFLWSSWQHALCNNIFVKDVAQELAVHKEHSCIKVFNIFGSIIRSFMRYESCHISIICDLFHIKLLVSLQLDIQSSETRYQWDTNKQ